MNNVFAIQRAESFHVQVMEYQWSRSAFSLKLSRQSSPDIQYVRFNGVEVFAGPMQWDGANFMLQPAAACLEVLQVAARLPDFATEKDVQERKLKLYTVELPQMSVQIVCTMASKQAG